LQQRPPPGLFTRSRPYRKNDNAHVEPRHWTHGRQHFGYERYENPAVAPSINAWCKGPLGQFQNHFLPPHKLESKRREGARTVRVYGDAQTPYARGLAAEPVSAAPQEWDGGGRTAPVPRLPSFPKGGDKRVTPLLAQWVRSRPPLG